ncbi:YiiX/YebB-like N1pC/P60 family cysteine hydrolase [Pectobacterium aroidearum]|uniref:YiiX/YebB-like N1pC/P60 family cysteine hydrolase n=1 Tax=Pectobacterium aroidearum TaxID=1201031 RepID=UPI0032EE210B
MSVTGLNAGDILLINTRTWYNIVGQKILRKSTSVNTTHVALSLGDGIFIHADTSCGVDLIFFPDLINKSDESWKVLRHAELNDDVEVEIKQAGVFHLSKTYNYGIILKENEKSLFCSQFVDLVYKAIGINIFSREESKGLINLDNALPVDFERLLVDDKIWCDVTKIYLDKINDNSIDFLKPNFQMEKFLIASSINLRREHSYALDLVHAFSELHNLLPDEHKNMELETHLSEMIKDLNDNESDIFYDFWNIRSKHSKNSN